MKPQLYCVARVIPLTAKKMRACGVVASSTFEGRPLCCRHLSVAERRAAERQGEGAPTVSLPFTGCQTHHLRRAPSGCPTCAKLEELEEHARRCQQDRYDALSVTSTDGLLASEWVARAGKAEREVRDLRRVLLAIRTLAADAVEDSAAARPSFPQPCPEHGRICPALTHERARASAAEGEAADARALREVEWAALTARAERAEAEVRELEDCGQRGTEDACHECVACLTPAADAASEARLRGALEKVLDMARRGEKAATDAGVGYWWRGVLAGMERVAHEALAPVASATLTTIERAVEASTGVPVDVLRRTPLCEMHEIRPAARECPECQGTGWAHAVPGRFCVQCQGTGSKEDHHG